MPDPVTEIPDRPAFKAAEVCEIAQIPPYVLRSWEKEFSGLGVAGKPGAPKIYRRTDVEQVLRIKHLLFAEGLTLAGARRKLEGEPPPESEAELTLPVPEEVRTKVATVKRELRSLLDLLGGPVGSGEGAGTGPSSSGNAAAVAQPAPATAAGAPAAPPGTKEPPAAPPAAAAAPKRQATQASTWPPAPAAPRNEGQPEEGPSLPLLDGTAEAPAAPARPRRSRRTARG